MNILVHNASPADLSALQALIWASVRGLQASDYTPAQIESALRTAFRVGYPIDRGRHLLYHRTRWRNRRLRRIEPTKNICAVVITTLCAITGYWTLLGTIWCRPKPELKLVAYA
jgi:hypothetical protein